MGIGKARKIIPAGTVEKRPFATLHIVLRRFSLIFLILIAACGEARLVPHDHLRLRLGAEPDTLNPLLAVDAYSSNVNGDIYDTLVERDRDTLEYKPKMASRWEVSADNKVFTFYIRPGIVWEDGQPFTAHDVVFSFNAIMDKRVMAPHLKVYYQDIAEVKAIDDLTVQFVFAKVYYKALTFAGEIQLLPRHVWEKELDHMAESRYSRAPVGLGPYKFKEWQTGKKIILERNEKYWGRKPEIKTVEYRIIHDDKIALQLLKKGDLDFFGLSTLQWARLTGSDAFNARFQKIKYPSAGYSYIGWNTTRQPFTDVRVRTAMTMMVDRLKISQKLYFGLAEPITGPFAPFSKQYNSEVKLLPYDPAAAVKLLNDAGWKDSDGDGVLDKDGKKFEFEFFIPSGSPSEKIAVIFKEDLRKIGVIMTISTMEWAAFLEKINKKDFTATSLGWSASIDSDPYQVWHSSQAKSEGGSNFVSFMNDKADKLMDQARITFEEEARNRYFHEIHRLIADEQPYTFLFNVPAMAAVSNRFGNVIVHKMGIDPLEWQVKKP